jgi:RNA polymerase sigma factor (sigma-70 family)
MRIVEPLPSESVGAAFDEFYRSEHAAAVRLAWLLTHDAAGCDDVVQDAFSAVFQRFDSLDRPAAYLRIAVVNRVRQNHRRDDREERRHRLVTAATETTTPGSVSGELADAIAKLPYRERAALVLRYWADMPEADIATALAVRPSTVRTLVRRALTTLRQEVER